MQEQYHPIQGFPGYEVSDLGNVRNITTGKQIKQGVGSHGYKTVNLQNNKKQSSKTVHRLVALSFLVKPNGKDNVDHKNNDKHDNRLENLRWCDKIENGRNQKIRKNNVSGVKGVGQYKQTNKWRARITINGRDISLGHYNTIEEAIAARQRVANELFGEFVSDCERL